MEGKSSLGTIALVLGGLLVLAWLFMTMRRRQTAVVAYPTPSTGGGLGSLISGIAGAFGSSGASSGKPSTTFYSGGAAPAGWTSEEWAAFQANSSRTSGGTSENFYPRSDDGGPDVGVPTGNFQLQSSWNLGAP